MQDYANSSIKGSGTKYDESSSRMQIKGQAAVPGGGAPNPTKVVHTMHINQAATVDSAKQTIMDAKRETNISQNTILGEEKIGANASEQLSQMGISVPGNASSLKAETNNDRQLKDPSSLQAMPMGGEHKSALNNFDLMTPNNQLKAVGVTRPIYNAQINNVEGNVGGKSSSMGVHKRLIDRKKESFPVKVTDLNNMVQIRKRKPKMKYNDRLIYRSNQERQVFS